MGGARCLWRLPGARRLTGRHDLLVRGDAPPGAGLPCEALEHPFPRVAPQPRGERAVTQHPRQRIAEGVDVAGLDEQTGGAVLDDLGQPADPTAYDRRGAGHGLQHRQTQKLDDGDVPAVARVVDRRKGQHRGLPVERREPVLRHRAEEAHRALARQPAQEAGVVALRWRVVMTRGPGDRELSALGDRADEAIDALVRRQAADKQDPPA